MKAPVTSSIRAGRAARPAIILTHSDCWAWDPLIDPARCPHATRAFFVGTPERLRKLCGGCGAVLADDLPRCPATSKKANRQCRLPARTDRGYATCAAHRPDRGAGRP